MIEQNSRSDYPLASISDIASSNDSKTKSDFRSMVACLNLRRPSESLQKFSFASLRTPAIFINSTLKIIWQNKSAQEDIWHNTSIMRNKPEPSSVFQLIFNANFQSLVENWRPWAGFFLQHGISISSRKHIEKVVEAQRNRYIDELRLLMSDLDNQDNSKQSNEQICQIQTCGTTVHYQVTSVDFAEGRLLIFDQDRDKKNLAIQPVKQITGKAEAVDGREIGKISENDAEPLEKPVYFIAARLSDADALQIEMLPGEYSRLLNRLWNIGVEIIEHFGGKVIDIKADGILAVFIAENPSDNQAITAIQCAQNLKSKAISLGLQRKSHKERLSRLKLNLGIHFCDEFVGSISTSIGQNLTTFGNGRQMASGLAAMASNGEIWASKDLIKQLPHGVLQQIHFGIMRDEKCGGHIIEHGFERVRNLSCAGACSDGSSEDFSSLITTRIFDICR